MLALWFVTHRTTNLNWKTTHWRIQNALKKNLVKIPREASLYLPLYKIYSSFSCRDSELFVECHTSSSRLDVNHRFLKQIQLTFLKAFNEETFWLKLKDKWHLLMAWADMWNRRTIISGGSYFTFILSNNEGHRDDQPGCWKSATSGTRS